MWEPSAPQYQELVELFAATPAEARLLTDRVLAIESVARNAERQVIQRRLADAGDAWGASLVMG